MPIDLTCIITGHREGHLAFPSLRSFRRAVDTARAAGFNCQTIYVLDRPNELTERLFRNSADKETTLSVVDFGDQGAARNFAIDRAEGHYSAFLDADDLWTSDWLVKALVFLKDQPDTHIGHPAYNYFFENQASIFTHVDQESEVYRPDLLRVGNYWDALCLCPTEIHREFPFYPRDIANGWAYEDWFWNCATVAAGKVHKVVPDTVLFKRRQKASQTIRASENKSMIRRNGLSRYDHPTYRIGRSS